MSSKNNNEVVLKVITGLTVAAAVASVYIANPEEIPLWYLITSGDVGKLSEFIRSYGVWAIAVSFTLDVLINIAGFLPSIFLSTANGLIFGLVPGIIISWLAETTGVVISFLLMRNLFRKYAEVAIKKSCYLQKVDEVSGKNGFKVMLSIRAMPYLPSGIVTALGAVSSISLWDYFLANLIGKLPSTALEVLIGHDVVNYEKNMGRLGLMIVALAFIYIGVWWWSKRRQATGVHEL